MIAPRGGPGHFVYTPSQYRSFLEENALATAARTTPPRTTPTRATTKRTKGVTPRGYASDRDQVLRRLAEGMLPPDGVDQDVGVDEDHVDGRPEALWMGHGNSTIVVGDVRQVSCWYPGNATARETGTPGNAFTAGHRKRSVNAGCLAACDKHIRGGRIEGIASGAVCSETVRPSCNRRNARCTRRGSPRASAGTR